jgi:hypothetical protein
VVLSAIGMTAWAVAGCAGADRAQDLARGERVQIEDDGLPVQAPPPTGIRQQADDPSEPFSPNYGSRASPAVPEARVRLSRAEEDAIIARAITEHEARHP